MKHILRLTLGGLLLVLCAVNPAVGGDGLALMKVEHGARPAGMGGAFVAVADDPNGAVYNPASITAMTGFAASFGHTAYWENVRLEAGYFAKSMTARTFLHGGIRFAAVDEIEQRLFPTSEPESYFDAHDASFKLGLSRRVSSKITVGASAGWFLEKIEAWRGWAFNFDLGVLVLPAENIALGASAVNLGSDFTLTKTGSESSREISLPTAYSVGGSYRYNRYLGAADIVYVDEEAHLHMGVEAALHELFSIRSGYMANYDSKNFTAGASFTKRNIQVDYAFVPYTNDLGTSHLFNLTVRI